MRTLYANLSTFRPSILERFAYMKFVNKFFCAFFVLFDFNYQKCSKIIKQFKDYKAQKLEINMHNLPGLTIFSGYFLKCSLEALGLGALGKY